MTESMTNKELVASLKTELRELVWELRAEERAAAEATIKVSRKKTAAMVRELGRTLFDYWHDESIDRGALVNTVVRAISDCADNVEAGRHD